jgi:hypothetical protein
MAQPIAQQKPGWPDSDLIEAAWGIIANAGGPGGNWDNETEEWRRAAEQWREAFHRYLKRQRG